MERYTGSRWPKGFGIVMASLILISLVTFHPFDPTVTNLLHPTNGIQNALGLPGSLIGGSLVEWAGSGALLIPVLVLNWFLCVRRRPRVWNYLGYGAALVLFESSLHGIVVNDPLPGPLQPGILGWVGGNWAGETTGAGLGAVLLSIGFIFAFTKVTYVIPWQKGVGDIQILSRFGWSRARTIHRVSIRELASNTRLIKELAHQFIRKSSDRLAEGRRNIWRQVASWNPMAYRPSLARVTRNKPSRSKRELGARLPVGKLESGQNSSDNLDAWFQQKTPTSESAPNHDQTDRKQPQTVETTEELQAPHIEKWEERLRRYRENIDLDWDSKVEGEKNLKGQNNPEKEDFWESNPEDPKP